ncbi:MAG: outer membrane beta-barrel protein [Rhodopila sp.]|jgi:hypothetical protein
MPSLTRWHWALATALGLLGSHPVKAQLIDQYFPQGVPGYDTGLGVTVQSRARSEYATPGVQLGDVVLNPSLSEGFGFNTNVTGEPKAQGSPQFDTSLQLRAGTDWARNGLFGYLSVDQQNYLDLPNQNQLSWVGAVGGTHDFGRDQLAFGYSHFNLEQTAAEVGSLNFQTPETFHIDDVRTSFKIDLGRFSVTPAVQISDFTFDQAVVSGQPSGQQYRDRVLVLGSVAVRYEFAPQRNAVLVFNGYQTDYTNPQSGQPSRNNSGGSILAGFEYTASGVLRYRGLIGLEERTYASNIFSSQTALVGDASMIWTPTELTTVTFSASRTIEDAASEAAVGYVYTTGRVTLDHEYRRNILLEVLAGVQAAAYQQDGGFQTITFAGGNVTWLLNRNMQLMASYSYSTSSVTSGQNNFAGNDYQQHILQLRLRLAL